jgi:hypothetical protein
VVLHLLNTLLLLWLLVRLTGALWRSALVAALFALHPLHVESVAWISERKDVLSTAFLLIALHAYVAYVRRPALRSYLSVVALFALGLMAKPMLVTFPGLLLLLDGWPLRRLEGAGGPAARRVRAGTLVFEKLPLLALSAISSRSRRRPAAGGAVSTSRGSPGPASRNALASYLATSS